MSEAALLLDRPVYRLDEVDGLLGTARGTARRWIDGAGGVAATPLWSGSSERDRAS